MRLCKDCAFFKDVGPTLEFGKCHKPGTGSKPKTNPVTGVVKSSEFFFASVNRDLGWLCGEGGKWWEPHEDDLKNVTPSGNTGGTLLLIEGEVDNGISKKKWFIWK